MNTNTKLLNEMTAGNFEKVLQMLRENIREEEAGKKGSKKPQKIIEKMMRDAMKKGSGIQNPAFCKAHPCSGGFGFLDGYRVFFADDSCGFEICETPFKLDDITKGHFDSQSIYTYKINMEELRYFAKIARSEGKYKKPLPFIIRTHDGFAGFNPLYLLDLLEYSNTDSIEYTHNNTPIFSDNRKALLLPVNINPSRDCKFSESDYIEYRQKWFEKEAA